MVIPITKPYFSKREIIRLKRDLTEILNSGRLILGKYTRLFENKFAELIKTKYAVAINTCTSALTACLNYYNVKKKEVIIPVNAFISCPNAVLYANGVPVFCEINPKTLSLDPNALRKRITSKTKAVVLIHIGGLISAEIYEIKKICKKNSLILIEDCAHACGARFKNKMAGSFGDAGCFSFYPTKVITTMVGGMVTTNDKKLAQYLKSVRFYGADSHDLFKIVNFGNDWLLDEFRCALGLSQLRQLDKMIKRKNKIAEYYNESLKNIKGITLIEQPENSINPFYRYIVYLKEGINRDMVIKLFKNKYNIHLSKVYIPCHLHPVYRDNFGYKKNDFPISEKSLGRVLTLPIYPQMTLNEAKLVVKKLKIELDKVSK